MQRQSLGSPGRERLSLSSSIPTDPTTTTTDTDHSTSRRRDSSTSLFSVSDVDDEIKPSKPSLRGGSHSTHPPPPEKLIHLIPVLVLFCFLILYLVSHDPSPHDMAQFHGFDRPDNHIIEANIDEIGRVESKIKVLRRSDAFVIRSLQEDSPKEVVVRSHRKLGDF